MILLDARKLALAQKALNEAARKDFRIFQALMHPLVSGEPYVDAVHLRAIAHKLQRVADRKCRRLLVAVPPRHFKSYQASVALPAFLLGQNPALRIITTSYGAELSDNFASQSRQILQSPRYRAIFPDSRLRKAHPPVHDLRTTHDGYRYATSVGGTLTGIGCDVLIVDDPLKASDAPSAVAREGTFDWLKSTAMTRFDKPAEGAVIVLMQRLHVDDMIGRLAAEGGWEMLELPAQASTRLKFEIGGGKTAVMEPGAILFPQRFNEAVLAERQRELGEAAFNSQYLQRPTPPGGHLFKLGKCPRFDLEENKYLDQYEAVIASLDTAVSTDAKANYSALTQWGVRGTDIYLLHAVRGRWTHAELIEKMTAVGQKVKAILIERAHSGILLMQALHSAGLGQKLIGYTPRCEKPVRAQHAALWFEQGRVHLPKSAPWLEGYEAEMAAFPHGKNDDWVDSTSQMSFVLKFEAPAWLGLSAYNATPVVRAYTI